MSREGVVELDVRLGFRDYLRASYWFTFRRQKFFLLLVSLAAIYVLLTLAGVTSTKRGDNYWGLLIPLALLMLMLGAPYISARRQMRSNRLMQEMMHYAFSDEGISAAAPSSSGHNSWVNVREAFETKSNFLLFISLNQFYLIPKSAFRDDNQIADFRQLLLRRVSSKAKLKR
jgi:hypothetical protein